MFSFFLLHLLPSCLVLDMASTWIEARCGQPELVCCLMKQLTLHLILILTFFKRSVKPSQISCLAGGMNITLCRMFWMLAVSRTAYKKLIAMFFLPSPAAWTGGFAMHALCVFFSHPLPCALDFRSEWVWTKAAAVQAPVYEYLRQLQVLLSERLHAFARWNLLKYGQPCACSFPASQNPCSSFPRKLLWHEDESWSERLILLEIRQPCKMSSFFSLVELGWKKQKQLFWFY